MSFIENTDLQGIKDLAQSMLYMDIKHTKLSPLVVKHPFTDNGVSAIKTKSGIQMVDLLKEDDLKLWREQQSFIIDQARSAQEIQRMITNSYAFAFLKYAKSYLSKADLSELLAVAWVGTEQPHLDPNITRPQMVSLFKKCDPEHLMDENELAAFRSLNDTLTIYRGVTSINEKIVAKSLSWTLDRTVAEWFATRYDQQGSVYQSTISKSHVFALFQGREEAEVIVDPKHLENITLL